MGQSRRAGFSLIELIAVMAVVAVIVVLAAPLLSGTLRGSSLTRASQMVVDQLALARQEAVSQNCEVEVRFYQITSGGGAQQKWSALQLWRVEQKPAGPAATAAGAAVFLPDGTEMATRNSLSPLISAAPMNGSVVLPGRGTAAYRAFRFRPNGSVESAVGESNYVTLILSADTANPPVNYCTIQLHLITGKSSVFRP